ncbi:MAG: hypothetical protein ACI3XR_06020 [Eubacteriales bacterium]
MKNMKRILSSLMMLMFVLSVCIACMGGDASLDTQKTVSDFGTEKDIVTAPRATSSSEVKPSDSPSQTVMYDVSLEPGEWLDGANVMGLFSSAPVHTKADSVQIETETIEYTDAAPESVTVGDQTLSLILLSQTVMNSGEIIRQQYEDETGRHYSVGESDFLISAALAESVINCNQILSGEEDYVAWVQSNIQSYLPDFDFDSYCYSCTTTAYYETPQAIWGTSVDRFCTLTEFLSDAPSDATTEIDQYTFRYVRYVDGFEILDYVIVVTDAQGNIRRISYQADDSGVDWTAQPFETEAVVASVDQFITAYGVSDRCEILSYDIDRMYLSCDDGSYTLSVWLTYRVNIYEQIDPEPVETAGLLVLTDAGINKGSDGYLG